MENHPVVNHPSAIPGGRYENDDQYTLDDIDDRMCGPVSGMIDKYFGSSRDTIRCH